MSESKGPTAPAATEALRRIKSTEREWDERLAVARREAEAEKRQLAAEAAAALRSALAEAEQARADVIGRARAEAEREAAAIEATGAQDAEALGGPSKGFPAAKREALLDAVLGDLRD
jgi:vacuolar-type H+-ATPase subunit H